MLSGIKAKVSQPPFYFPMLRFNNREMRRILISVFWLILAARGLSRDFTDAGRPVVIENQGDICPDPVMDTVLVREIEILAKKRMEKSGIRITRPDSMALHSGLSADLSELLSSQTPVFVKNYGPGAQSTAHFRGTSASHTQIIWNGISLNSPMRGYTDLSQVPLFFVDEIYLLHGGSSLTETSGALGGSIHLENQPDWLSKRLLTVKAERGSFQTGRYSAKLQLGSDKILSVTRLYNENSENEYPFYNTGVLPHQADTLRNGAFRKQAMLQEFYYRSGSEIMVTLRGWIQDNHRDLPPLMSYEGDPREEGQHDRQTRVQMEVKKYGGAFNLSYNAGYNNSKMDYFLYLPLNNYQVSDAKSGEEKLYNQLRMNYVKNDRFALTATLEGAWQKVKARELVKQDGYEVDRLEAGTMIQLMVRPTTRSGLYFLSRSEYYDNRFIAFIPSAGAEWQFRNVNPMALRMNLTRNYHKPGLNDLYWIPGGNPELLPEEGVTGEMIFSSQYRQNGVSLRQELSGYASEIKNWIIWQPAQNGAWFWEAVNLDRVKSAGLEYNFSGDVRYRQYKFSAGGNYALTRSYRRNQPTETGYSNRRQLIYIPVHSANFQAGAARQGYSALLHLGFTGRRYTQTSNQWTSFENSLPPFMVTSLSLQKDFPVSVLKMGVKAKVENLFNVRYQQILWRPMPGRNYSVTIVTNLLK